MKMKKILFSINYLWVIVVVVVVDKIAEDFVVYNIDVVEEMYL